MHRRVARKSLTKDCTACTRNRLWSYSSCVDKRDIKYSDYGMYSPLLEGRGGTIRGLYLTAISSVGIGAGRTEGQTDI